MEKGWSCVVSGQGLSNGEFGTVRYGVGNWGMVLERGWTLFKYMYDGMIDTIGKSVLDTN